MTAQFIREFSIMCGIAGIISLSGHPIKHINHYLNVMSSLIAHRGPDDNNIWVHHTNKLGFAHRRLSIIDLSDSAKQPMISQNNNVISYNGEIYNYIELKNEFKDKWIFKTNSDTECILASYEIYNESFLNHLRGMFAFALWNEKEQTLICARDRFGIKPFYYTIIDDLFIFSSEIKAMLPFLKQINTDEKALVEYLTFQYTLEDKTLFKNIKQLSPGHLLKLNCGKIHLKKYWDIHFSIDFDHSKTYFEKQLKNLLNDSINLHMRSDVPVGSYLSGGIDSSLITLLANDKVDYNINSFHGKFTEYKGYDESKYALDVANTNNLIFNEISISANDFKDSIEKIIYHMDFPVGGPGVFPQFMVSKLASKKVKVLLAGQGGDEIFGGYARYLIAYFEQCIKAAIEGTYKNGNFVVTAETIIPNLGVLKEYQPLIKEFWKEGLFEDIDNRYFRLIDRSINYNNEINWDELDKSKLINTFKTIFNNTSNVGHTAYYDKMTHFDFKCLLPALLHVEDRMSMAHGIESRVPFLDHPLVEFVATVPANIKFEHGQMKHFLKTTYKNILPNNIYNRRDKMGFPVPLNEWFNNELKDWVYDIFNNPNSHTRSFVNTKLLLPKIQDSNQFSREIWGLFCLELWQQTFHDKFSDYKNLIK